MTDLSQFKDLYVKTAKDYLTKIQEDIAKLREKPTDQEAIADLHIATHSLKSQSLVMKYTQTGILGGTLEFLFRDVKEGKVNLTPAILDAVSQAVAVFGESVDTIAQKGQEKDVREATHELEEKTGEKYEIQEKYKQAV